MKVSVQSFCGLEALSAAKRPPMLGNALPLGALALPFSFTAPTFHRVVKHLDAEAGTRR